MLMLFVKSFVLVATREWQEGSTRHWVGLSAHAAQFRRQLFPVLQEIFFTCIDLEKGPLAPAAEVLDEVMAFACLIPMCYSNLRAPLRDVISCTDASEEGGAAGEASHLIKQLTSSSSQKLKDFWQMVSEESSSSRFTGVSCVHVCM